MSIAIMNASIGNSLTVGGTSTLSGALTSGSTINCQGITTTSLQVNGVNSSTFSGIHVNGNTTLKGSLQCVPYFQTSGTNNLALGQDNLSALTTGSNNNGLGYETLGQLISGSFNIAIGYQSGGGILSDNNICIGRNAGIEPSNSFTQSVCIGINSKITASNQITLGTANEAVKIPGSIGISGSSSFNIGNNGQLIVKQNILTYTEWLDNYEGNAGLQIGWNNDVGSGGTDLINNAQGGEGNSFSFWRMNSDARTPVKLATISKLGVASFTGLIINDAVPLYLRNTTTSTSLAWNSTIDGPALQGLSGGKLGTVAKSDIITWNSTSGINVALNANTNITGLLNLGGSTYVNDNAIYLRGDSNHSLRYNASADGPALQGFSGGKLGTSVKSDVITWNSTTGINVALNANTNITGLLNLGGNVILNDKPIYLRGSANTDHSLSFNLDVQGPSLQGFSGGKLGTVAKSDVITWNSTSGINTIGINGNLSISVANEIRMNQAPIFLKTVGDDNHVLKWVGGLYDGPSLQGAAGGTLRTVANPAVLTWSNTSVNMNLPIICNSSIQQPSSGYHINFYRKTNCTTSETYNFQSANGKYEVLYNANHDRNTTSRHFIDVLNSVNGGSFIIDFYKGSGIYVNIDINTNIFQISCTVSGGTLQINRLMSY